MVQPQWLGGIGRNSGLGFLCHSLLDSSGSKELFPGSGYLQSKDGVAWHFLVNLDLLAPNYILLRQNSQFLMVIGKDSCFSTLCYSSSFACQQRV